MAKAKRQPTRTVAEIEAEIARLQNERDSIRAAEVEGVVGRIKEAISHYGLTAEDLGLSAKRGRRPVMGTPDATPTKKRTGQGAATGAKPKPGMPKYSNGEGKTWSGHGRRPGWFVEAIVAGKSPEDLLVKSAG